MDHLLSFPMRSQDGTWNAGRIVRVVFAALFAWTMAGAGTACQAVPERHGFQHAAMGTEFHLVLYAENRNVAAQAAAAAFGRIDEVERIATDYDAGSEARRLVDEGALRTIVSAPLGKLIHESVGLAALTRGAFDPSIGPLAREWKRALRTGEWPKQERWDDAAERVGLVDHVALEKVIVGGVTQYRVTTALDGMRLDFGGIAKGYAVDLALAELRGLGIQRALLDGGGDVAALDPPPGSDGWKVEVRPFGDEAGGGEYRFLLANAAVATSGDVFQGAHLVGTPLRGILDPASRFGHVIDPRTMLPLPSPRAALMTAPTALSADALATALMVMGEAALVAPDARGPGGEPRPYETDPWRALRGGIFFPSKEGDPCVGGEFPQDGVRVIQGLDPPDPR